MHCPAAPVSSKSQNHRLWQSGAFGNKLRAWRTLSEWRQSGHAGMVALRTLLPWGGGGPCIYDLEPDSVESRYRSLLAEVEAEHVVICEAAPAEVAILQGEFLNRVYDRGDGTFGWDYFYCSRARMQMRDSLRAEPRVVEGLASRLLIQDAMTPGSWQDFQVLLDRYPDHVLEVSIYDRCLGDVPGRNALVWEVRRY